MNAEYIGVAWRDPKGTVLEYEYRGKKYHVTDYGWNGGEPLSWQHKMAQARIDSQIDLEKEDESESADVGIDIFFSQYEDISRNEVVK